MKFEGLRKLYCNLAIVIGTGSWECNRVFLHLNEPVLIILFKIILYYLYFILDTTLRIPKQTKYKMFRRLYVPGMTVRFCNVHQTLSVCCPDKTVNWNLTSISFYWKVYDCSNVIKAVVAIDKMGGATLTSCAHTSLFGTATSTPDFMFVLFYLRFHLLNIYKITETLICKATDTQSQMSLRLVHKFTLIIWFLMSWDKNLLSACVLNLETKFYTDFSQTKCKYMALTICLRVS